MNTYIISISSKYLKNIIRLNIKIKRIKKENNYYILYLDTSNYVKILKYQEIFNIKLIGLKGFIKYKYLLKKYSVFVIFFVLMLIYVIFLSNLIFNIEINTNNKEVVNLLEKELKENGISLYRFVKNFKQKEKIKNIILNKHKEEIGWLEITRHGSKYIINVEERIINDINEDKTPCNIIAKKNAIILSIEATSGSIVKKLNDYVKKGEVIVSGNIIHKENVVDKVKSKGVIYGETWYHVHVSYPFAYYEKIKTGNNLKRLSLKIFNKSYSIGSNYKNEEIEEINILNHKFIPIKLSFDKVSEIILIDDLYTIDEAYEEGLKLARSKLLSTLPLNSKILSQKKLKLIVNNSTIDIDIFFKVYENITEIQRIEENHE